MKEDTVIKLLKKLRFIKPFKSVPRGNSNHIWRSFKLKEAKSLYEKGLYSKAEYEQKIKKICSGSKKNQK